MKMLAPLDHLIKERKKIVTTETTVTKFSDANHTAREVRSLKIANRTSLPIAKLIDHTETSLTMDFYPGLSAFQLLEILYEQGRHGDIYSVLNKLAARVKKIQSECGDAVQTEYPFALKLGEIKTVLKLLDHSKEYDLLNEVEQKIINLLTHIKHVPFRDATPKNYIVKNTLHVGQTDAIDDLDIIAIDFATFHYGTHKYDDLISLFFHYIVETGEREKLIAKYMPEASSLDAQAILVLRLGRFWVRRAYYKKFHPELFKKRYKFEDTRFYEQAFFGSLKKISDDIQLLQ